MKKIIINKRGIDEIYVRDVVSYHGIMARRPKTGNIYILCRNPAYEYYLANILNGARWDRYHESIAGALADFADSSYVFFSADEQRKWLRENL